MSEELSRVRSRQKQYKGAGQSPVKENNGNGSSESAARQLDTPVLAPGTLSRKVRHAEKQTSRKPKREVEQQEGEATPPGRRVIRQNESVSAKCLLTR